MGPLDTIQKGFDLLAGVGLPSSLVWYWRDRKKNRAAGRIAEGSVSAEISSRDTAALDAHVAYVERAFETERKSMDRQVKALEHEVRELRIQVNERDQLIDSLRSQVAALSTQMQSLQRQLDQIPPAP